MRMRVKVIRRNVCSERAGLLPAERAGGIGMLFLLGARLLLWPSPVLTDLQLLAVYWLYHICGWSFLALGCFLQLKGPRRRS